MTKDEGLIKHIKVELIDPPFSFGECYKSHEHSPCDKSRFRINEKISCHVHVLGLMREEAVYDRRKADIPKVL